MYVIGADEEQFDKLEKNLTRSGIKVIKQNNLASEFEQLTLVSAIAFPIGTVEDALDQDVYTSLVQGGNQFYTDSAGLYFPNYKPKLVDIYTNTCNSHLITLSTFQGDFFKLTVEQFIESEQGYEYKTIGEYQGTIGVINKVMSAYFNNELVFKANEYYETAVQADGLEFSTATIPQVNGTCKIIKRKNLS